MLSIARVSAERIADEFINYLFDQYKGSRHVRRVASWIGMLVKAIERVGNGSLRTSSTRQVKFRYRGRRFKVRFNHSIGGRGGIEIVEYFAGPGAPEGEVAVQIANLDDAHDVSENLEARLDQVIDGFGNLFD
jgi:hypothetical protein